jgi:aldehyde dehydrogenase (NAD+)
MPRLDRIPSAVITTKIRNLLDSLLDDAKQRGAIIARDGRQSNAVGPTILLDAQPDHAIMQTDIFAPVLSFCAVPDLTFALQANSQCPYALTAAIFGSEKAASRLATQLRVGTVLINDLIVSTADPRVPFGGRGQSGFGLTRGREGLLEMTTTKTILRQKNRSLRPYTPTGAEHKEFFSAFIQAMHSGSIALKYQGLRRFIASARNIEKH